MQKHALERAWHFSYPEPVFLSPLEPDQPPARNIPSLPRYLRFVCVCERGGGRDQEMEWKKNPWKFNFNRITTGISSSWPT